MFLWANKNMRSWLFPILTLIHAYKQSISINDSKRVKETLYRWDIHNYLTLLKHKLADVWFFFKYFCSQLCKFYVF